MPNGTSIINAAIAVVSVVIVSHYGIPLNINSKFPYAGSSPSIHIVPAKL